MPQIFLSIGSNINREENIRLALDALVDEFSFMRVSSVYETPAVGFDGDCFYNLAVAMYTNLSPSDVHTLLKEIEKRQGRSQAQKGYTSRTIDIDLLTYGDVCGEVDGIQFPRKEIFKHAFVLHPLVELAGEQTIPGRQQTYIEKMSALKKDAELFKKLNFTWRKNTLLPTATF